MSYEFKQSLNAATSVNVATGYCSALNHMLKKGSPHCISLITAVCCFWTKDPKNPLTPSINNLFQYADPKSVQEFFSSPHRGKTSSFAKRDRFYALVMSGNAGRIMVRHWIDIPLETAYANFQSWFQDLDLAEAKPSTKPSKGDKKHSAGDKLKSSPLALYRLAAATVRDTKELRTEIVNQLFLAAFQGQAPAISLLQPLLARLRITMAQDGTKALWNHSLFALMRLIINRNQRIHRHHKENSMDIPPKLDTSLTQDPGYLCGRLLAVLSRTQDKAHNYQLKGAGVAERYFGTAMTSPQSVFPLLLKLNRHHLNKIDKNDPKGYADDYLEQDIQNITQHLSDFPRSLDLKGQGRFALGYYHEQAALQAKIREYKKKAQTPDNTLKAAS